MRVLAVATTILWFSLPTHTFAQATDEIEVMRSMAQTERKLVIAKNMNLTDAESEVFWPVYNEYHEKKRKVNDKLVKALQELGREWDTLSGERSQEILKDYLDYQEQRLKLRRKYLKNFNDVLPPKKVTRYYQVENKLDIMFDFGLAGSIPLVE
jgi:hypothetical protein